MKRRPWTAGVAVLAAVLLTAGCTNLPASSPAQRIESVPAQAQGPAATISPQPNDQPRTIVQNFIRLNASADTHHNAAREFLTRDAAARWSDTTATIVNLDLSSDVDYDAKTKKATVTGRPVGRLSADGVYTPSLQGLGTGGDPTPYTFTLKLVSGQYRIDQLPNGLLLRSSDFSTVYKQHPIYFLDPSDSIVIPDLRSTNLLGSQLQNWLLARLAGGPQPALANAVDSDTFPANASGGKLSVTQGDNTLTVEIPGSSGLGAEARDHLAGQIALTLGPTQPPGTFFTITDGGPNHRVSIVASSGPQFVPEQFRSIEPTAPPAQVYYLRYGRIVAQSGRVVGGRLTSAPDLTSIGVARRGVNDALTVAGVVGQGPASQLYVGTESDGLTSTPVRGLTSRPAWAPGLDEVWVGTGRTITRYLLGTGVRTVDLPATPSGERIMALRLSPEGLRVALVEQAANGSQQLYVGSIVRSGQQVRIDDLEQISPDEVSVLDVGWLDDTELFAIGYRNSDQNSEIVKVNVDGSNWDARGIGSLPYGPDSVTVVANQFAWVSSGGSVYQQDGTDWTSAGPTSSTPGTEPVFLE